jgi:hypothetical protein
MDLVKRRAIHYPVNAPELFSGRRLSLVHKIVKPVFHIDTAGGMASEAEIVPQWLRHPRNFRLAKIY